MREIKFRGKTNAYPSRWVHGYLANKKYINEYDNGDFYFTSIKEETIGQYTGIKDQKGKEIFEGDIVQAVFNDQEEPGIKGVVIYVEAAACYMVIANNGDEWELGYLDEIEKIGNKWDNPELLKKGE